MHPCARDRVSSAHLTIRPLSSVQPELAVDRADLGRLDQTRMRHGDRGQRAFQGLQPEIEEFVERRKYRARILKPHQEAGYTSAVVTVAPNPVSLLQSGGVHIRPHMGVKGTFLQLAAMSVIDPTRTLAS